MTFAKLTTTRYERKEGTKFEAANKSLRTLNDLYDKKERACAHGNPDPSVDDCHDCSLTNYGRNCHNLKLPAKTEFTYLFSGLTNYMEED